MSFFKAYDMRGTFGTDFGLDTVFRVGAALPGVVSPGEPGRRPRWLVGRDGRVSSAAIRDALVAGLESVGAEVEDIGLSTTPMVYFFTGEDGYDGSVMVTASHNPPSDNGLKVSRRSALPVSYASGLADVERLVLGACGGEPAALAKPSSPAGGIREDFVSRYVSWMREKNPHLERANSSLRFAVDCSNGVGAIIARRLFPDAIIVNGEIDGSFPAHSPNPLRADARERLSAIVRERGLDCGVIFDGDADRAMFVDEKGEFVQPDYLIPVVARASLAPSSGVSRSPCVIHDIRTSRGAIEAIREMGCKPVMVPVGPALAKPMMRETLAPAGGELAGHYYFADFHCCDSGALAAVRILCEIADAKSRGVAFSAMMRPIVSRYANSGEMNFRVEDKDAAIDRAIAASGAFGEPSGRSDIDGVRLEFADGWFNIRKSNTEPFLRLIAEHRSRKELERWLGVLGSAIGA